MSPTSHFIQSGFLFLLCFFWINAYAADYLDELATEADASAAPSAQQDKKQDPNVNKDSSNILSIDEISSTGDKPASANEKPSNWDIKKQGLGRLLPQLSQPDFEESLKLNFFATHILYRRLDPTSKNMVYQAYLKNPDIKHVRTTIGNLSK